MCDPEDVRALFTTLWRCGRVTRLPTELSGCQSEGGKLSGSDCMSQHEVHLGSVTVRVAAQAQQAFKIASAL